MVPSSRPRLLRRLGTLAGALGLLVFAACGAEPGTGSSGLGGAAPTGEAPTSARVLIGPSHVSPRSVRVQPGGRVELLNDDGKPHELYSSPHPGHSGCPELNLGVIEAGASVSVTLASPASCWFHDEAEPGNVERQGTIEVVVPGTTPPS